LAIRLRCEAEIEISVDLVTRIEFTGVERCSLHLLDVAVLRRLAYMLDIADDAAVDI
jgi:hypothetical protein